MPPEPFRRAYDEYQRMRALLERKAITTAAFEKALNELVVEHEGRFWMLGVNSGGWYMHDGQNWVSAQPPQIEAATVALSHAAGRANADYATVPLPIATVAAVAPAAVERVDSRPAEPPPALASPTMAPPSAAPPALAAPAGAAVAASAETLVPTASTRAYRLAFALQIANGLMVLALGVLLTWVVLVERTTTRGGDPAAVLIATGPMALGMLMLLLGFASLSGRWLLALLAPALIAGIGFACTHYRISAGHDFWWWPELLVAVGGAGFVGALVGVIVRRNAR